MTRIGNQFRWMSLSFVFALVFSTSQAQAQVVLQASIERPEVGLNEVFEVTVSVVSKSDVNMAEPRVPALDGFILKGKNAFTQKSHKMVQTPQGMDWQSQNQYNFVYMFKPTRLGRLTVGSFEVVIDGKPQQTQPLNVTVVNQATRPSAPQRGARPSLPGFAPDEDPFEAMDRAEEEMFNQLLQRRRGQLRQVDPQIKTLPTNPNEAFFIQVEVDKTEVYEGEQVTVSWYIYTRGQMESLDRAKFPDLKGFWKEIIEEVPSIQFSEEIVNGIPYRKALLASHALFPLKAGTAVIDEFKIKSRVRLPQPGSYFGLGPSYEYTRSSKPIHIKVLPLPTEGRPANFSGAVGQFQVSARIDQNQVPVNQPFSVRIRFEGSGNAKGIELPAIAWPQGFEIYDTKSESKFFKNGVSFKEFEVLVIPRQEGSFQIPSISVSLFDPQQKKYISQVTQPLTLQVVPNPQGGNAPAANASSSSGKMSSTGPRNSNTSAIPSLPEVVRSWSTSSPLGLLQNPLWGLGAYGFAFFGLLFQARKQLGWGRKRRTLKEVTLRKLKNLEPAVKKKDHRRIGVGMVNLFSAVLGEISEAGGGSEEIHRLLEKCPPSLRHKFAEPLLRRFEYFQTLGFAPIEILSTLDSKFDLAKEFHGAKDLLMDLIQSYGEADSQES